MTLTIDELCQRLQAFPGESYVYVYSFTAPAPAEVVGAWDSAYPPAPEVLGSPDVHGLRRFVPIVVIR